MLRAILVAILGLILGALLGAGSAYVIHQSELPEKGWTSYPTLAQAAKAEITTPLTSVLYPGLLWGGGCGAIVGAVIGATGAIVQAIRNQPR